MVLSPADVFGHQIQLRGGDVEAVRARITDLDIVLLRPVHRDLEDTGKPADAVVLVDHQVPYGQVRARADALPVGHGLPALSRADGRRHDLGISEYRKPCLGALQSSREAPHRHAAAPGGRQRTVGEAPDRRQSVFFQRGEQHVRPPLIGREDRHPVVLGQIMPHVAERRLQTAPVGGELPDICAEDAPGLQGIAPGGKSVRHHHREILQSGAGVLPGQHICLCLAHGNCGLGEKAHIVPERVGQLPGPLGTAVGGVHEHKGVRGKVVQGGHIFLKHPGQVPVRPGELRALREPLRVPAQPPDGVLPVAAAADQPHPALQHGGQGAGVGRQSLPARQHPKGVDGLAAALGVRVEKAHGVDLVAPELGPDGPLGSGGIYVQNAAPAGKLAGPLHHLASAVAAAKQRRLQGLGPGALPHPHGEGGTLQALGGQRPLQQPRHSDHCGVGPLQEGVQSGEPPLLVLTGYRLRVVEYHVPAREHHRRPAQQGRQISGQGPGGGVVRADHRQRPARAFAQHGLAYGPHGAPHLGDQGRQTALLCPQGEGVQGGCFRQRF